MASARLLLSLNVSANMEKESRHSSGLSPAIITKALPSAKFLNVTPDELFSKYTVAEVRAVQKRLRADADAKQEELRLMVGERYRDLLQASSSIIAIAKSSKHVLEAIEGSKNAILSQDDLPPPPKTATVVGVDDRHLNSLQVLSVHIKLLLDAPEHLWRLIERKKYLEAAWLFLLTRVVYRALVSNDDNDEQPWVEDGVDVQRDFPLVKRQWDVVSQFRSQIIHKSTLSLREASTSAKETCATLITMHLLDSRPLHETLSTFLAQRSRTLQAVLSWKLDVIGRSRENASPLQNDHAGASRSIPIREVTQVMRDALNTISQTMGIARAVFHQEGEEPSMLSRFLESTQTEPENHEIFTKLPPALQLSTQSLLSQLTSSANFQLLPPDLRSYRPYVDLGSPSTSIAQALFLQKLKEWFHTSCEQWHSSSTKLLFGLHTVKEVWKLRTSIKRSLVSSGLMDNERDFLASNMDSLCHDQIIGIWQRMLIDAGSGFKQGLRSRVSTAGGNDLPIAFSTTDFLFSPPPIPVLSQTKSFVEIPFQKYQLALKRQLVGRSSALDNVLLTLEDCARTIQLDLAIVKGPDNGKTRPLIEKLKHAYQPKANALSSKVVEIIDEIAADVIESTESDTRGLVFLSRTTDVLFSSSPFIHNISCSEEMVNVFREKISLVNDRALEKWRTVTIKAIVDEALPQLGSISSQANGPSHALVRALLTLSEKFRNLGIVYHPVKQHAVVPNALRHLFQSLLDVALTGAEDATLHDLAYIRKFCELYGPSWTDLHSQIDRSLSAACPDDAQLEVITSSSSDYLVRSQTLLSILLPTPAIPKLDIPLLQFGVPPAGQSYNSGTDLAKPTPRFGMLLVGKAET